MGFRVIRGGDSPLLRILFGVGGGFEAADIKSRNLKKRAIGPNAKNLEDVNAKAIRTTSTGRRV